MSRRERITRRIIVKALYEAQAELAEEVFGETAATTTAGAGRPMK